MEDLRLAAMGAIFIISLFGKSVVYRCWCSAHLRSCFFPSRIKAFCVLHSQDCLLCREALWDGFVIFDIIFALSSDHPRRDLVHCILPFVGRSFRHFKKSRNQTALSTRRPADRTNHASWFIPFQSSSLRSSLLSLLLIFLVECKISPLWSFISDVVFLRCFYLLCRSSSRGAFCAPVPRLFIQCTVRKSTRCRAGNTSRKYSAISQPVQWTTATSRPHYNSYARTLLDVYLDKFPSIFSE